MYKVLIVDDQDAVREGLSIMLEWESLGFTVNGYAANGKEAINQIQLSQYDLVITDVRMPIIDGIMLIKKMKSMNYQAKIIIISGYKEFEYARAAVEYGVKNYILKPIDEEVLAETLSSIKNELDRELSLKTRLEDNQLANRNRFIQKLMKQRVECQGIHENANKVGIGLDNEFFCMAEIKLLHLNIDDEFSDFGNTVVSPTDKIEYMLNRHFRSYVVDMGNQRMAVLLCLHNNETEVLKLAFEEVFNYIRMNIAKNAVIAVGNIVSSCMEISESYRNVCEIVESRLYAEGESVIFYKEVLSGEKRKEEIFTWEFDKLVTAVGNCDKHIMCEEIDSFISWLGLNKPTVKVLYGFTAELYIKLMNMIENMGGNIFEAIGEDFSFEDLYGIRTIGETQVLLEDLCTRVSDYARNMTKNRANKNIYDITEYIKKNYNSDINIKRLSKIFFMNPVYLGRLFRKCTGTSFTDYLNDYRVERAAEILVSLDTKVYEVCENIGYKDIKYFYKVFKERKGITPSEFRLLYNKDIDR